MEFEHVPTKTVPDWSALVAVYDERGAFYLPPNINAESARVCLCKHGLTVKPVTERGAVIAYRVQKPRQYRKQTKGA